MKKKSFVSLLSLMAVMVAVLIGAQGCKAQRTIAATGYTIVSHDDGQKADSVRCAFKLEEKYSGVQVKK